MNKNQEAYLPHKLAEKVWQSSTVVAARPTPGLVTLWVDHGPEGQEHGESFVRKLAEGGVDFSWEWQFIPAADLVLLNLHLEGRGDLLVSFIRAVQPILQPVFEGAMVILTDVIPESTMGPIMLVRQRTAWLTGLGDTARAEWRDFKRRVNNPTSFNGYTRKPKKK